MADVQLKVSTSDLKRKADEIKQVIHRLQGDYDDLKHAAGITRGYWGGDASDVFRSYVENTDKDMQALLKKLSKHPDNLLEIAGVYSQSEQETVDFLSVLPNDVIS